MLSDLNLAEFLPVARESMNRNLAARADADNVKPPLLHLRCIEEMQGMPALDMFHAGFLVAADIEDMSKLCGTLRMKAIVCDTVVRRTQIALITGLLSEWYEGLPRAQRANSHPEVQDIAEKINTKFRIVGLNLPNHTLMLESK
jgi:hypothetical protein